MFSLLFETNIRGLMKVDQIFFKHKILRVGETAAPQYTWPSQGGGPRGPWSTKLHPG